MDKKLKDGYAISYDFINKDGDIESFVARYCTDINELIKSNYKEDVDGDKVLSHRFYNECGNIVTEEDAFEEVTKVTISIDEEVRDLIKSEMDGMTEKMLKDFYFDRRYPEIHTALTKRYDNG